MAPATIILAILLVAGLVLFFTSYYLPLKRIRNQLLSVNPDNAEASHALSQAGIVTEITERVSQLIETNQLSSQRADAEGLNLNAILGSMREGVVLLDNQKRIRLANDEIYRLLPPALSPINRTLLELFRNHVLHRAIEMSFSTSEPQNTEFSIDIPENGQLVAKIFDVTSIGMTGRNGEIVGALAVFHDLTRVKALEGVRKDFVANVSHELRTPLSIISGYIETMLDDNLEDVDAGRKFLAIMYKHTERLHLLVEDLLTISLLESHRGALVFSPLPIPDSIQRVVEQLEPALHAKELSVTLHFPSDFPLVEIDAHRMDQVFFNLLDNAVKHGRKGDQAIEIIGVIFSDRVRVSVRDHGPGISQKDQPHIFERFYRVDEARSREAGGTGLGLSIVKHVVQAHGGKVEVFSRPGDGATFQVDLPLCQSGEADAKKV